VLAGIGKTAGVRLTDFWERMDATFGKTYARSVAADRVFASLGERTVDAALAAGEDTKDIWAAVCAEVDVPRIHRHR
jgi:hypothetical protein